MRIFSADRRLFLKNSVSLCDRNDGSRLAASHVLGQELTEKLLAPHEFALMDMVFSNDEAFLCRPQPGLPQCKYVFFPGCQATAIAPATVWTAALP